MSVNVEVLKQLREQSGAGMSACKDALIEANGDINQAMKILREKGIASAGKKADREMKEGLCGVVGNGTSATIVKISCETDFVVRNEKFQSLAKNLLTTIDKSGATDLASAKAVKLSSGQTIEEEVAANVGIIGENISLSKVEKITVKAGYVSVYVHSQVIDGFGKIAVALGIESEIESSKLSEFGKQICMHIAAFSPIFLKTEDVSEEFINTEREIYTKQLESSGKKPEIIAKIVEGKLQKTYQEQVLVEQDFALDSSIKVKDFIAQSEKALGGKISLSKFVRLSVV